MREQIMGRFVGARVRRVEDRRLLSGRGRYVDDVVVPDMAHAAFVRSPWPHALIRGIDTTRAAAVPGVYAIFTGPDMAAITNPLMGMLALPGLYDPWHWALAVDRVRLVGDPVAIVVATSRAVAEDAAEIVDVEYEELEPIATLAHAHDPSRPAIWPKANGNVVYAASESFGDVDAAFAGADRVISETFRQHRHANQPMETRGTVAEIDADGNLTLHAAHQAAHALKWAMAMCLARQPVWMSVRDMFRQREQTKAIFAGAREFVRAHPTMMKDTRLMMPIMLRQIARDPMRMVHLNRALLGLMATPRERLPRVVTGDIGGAFGSKATVLREDIALCAAALRLGRSIKWIEDRNEHLVLGGQARDETVDVEAAVMNDGTLLGLRAKLTMDAGAYPGFPFAAPMFCRIIQTMFPGPYRFDGIAVRHRGHLVQQGDVRRLPGSVGGRDLGARAAARRLARELGISRDEIRLRNIVGPDELPTTMVTGPTLDVRMSARPRSRGLSRSPTSSTGQSTRRRRGPQGRSLGLGFATYIEAAPGPPDLQDGGHARRRPRSMAPSRPAPCSRPTAPSRSTPSRCPTARATRRPWPRSPPTSSACPIEQVRVALRRHAHHAVRALRHRRQPVGGDGRRRRHVRGARAARADPRRRRRPARGPPSDLVDRRRRHPRARASPRSSVSFADVAGARRGGHAEALPGEAIRPRTTAAKAAGRRRRTCAGSRSTSRPAWCTIHRYVVVEDCGELINPAVVDGQIRGGVAQGIGAVLYEKIDLRRRRPASRPGTFMDYLIPTAMEIPEIEIHHVETPSTIDDNYRGVGEGGMIVAPAAITNAIEDALAHLGVRITEQHLPPTRILELAGVIPERTDR